MARRAVTEAGWRYLVADDDRAADDRLFWAIVRCSVVDELTLEPPRVPIALTTTTPRARARIADGGLCGLTARPRDAAAALLSPGRLTAAVTAPGYLPRDLTPAIDAARRTLSVPAGASVATVAPADPAPRLQFTPGRGVLLERAAPTDEDQFTIVSADPPGSAGEVPLRDPVSPPRPIGARVAGVPIALPVQPLHRDAALTVRGRVQLRTGADTLVPATGASVAIAGVWWDYPSAIPSAPFPPDLCSIEPPLRFAYEPGAGVHSCTLTPIGPARSLAAGAPAAAREILVEPNQLLDPLGDDLLRLGNPLTAEDEIVVSDGFEPATLTSAAVRVRLRTPTAILHRANEPVQLMQAAAITAVGAVAREALPGDRVLFAAGLPVLPTVSTLIVGHMSPRQSFHRARQLPTTPDGITFRHLVTPDSAGRFTWPPLARVAQIRVVASHPPQAAVERDVTLDYGSDPTLAIIIA